MPEEDMDGLGRPLFEEAAPGPGIEDPHELVRTRRAQSLDKARRRRDADVLRKLMMSEWGRDWLFRLLESCHIYERISDLGTVERVSDPYITYFRDGERNVGNRILIDAQRASADLYMTMIKEANEKRQAQEDNEESEAR